jgi:ribonuclease-3
MAFGPLLQGHRVKISQEIRAFQAKIGHEFAAPEVLQQALTHASISTPTRPDNQRLEFLGDRVLGLVLAETLLAADPTAPEGLLAPRFNALVRKETCADVAREIGLGDVLKLGRSEMMTGGRRKQALLGDAMEAVIAAVYLDAGFEAARDLILRLWGARIGAVADDARDAKTSLQEWAQARGLPPPQYIEVSRQGPDHAPLFTIEVQLASGQSERAQAGAKRQAEQAAASALLARMEQNDE